MATQIQHSVLNGLRILLLVAGDEDTQQNLAARDIKTRIRANNTAHQITRAITTQFAHSDNLSRKQNLSLANCQQSDYD